MTKRIDFSYTIVCIIKNLLILFNLFLLQLEILQQTLNQKTNVSPLLTQKPIHSDNSHILNILTSKQTIQSSLNATKNSAASESQKITTIDLSKDDNINILKPIVSESQTSSKNEILNLAQVDVAAPQKSVSVASNSNDLEETVDTNETSVMNIKITNVTSLPPEVFENVPDVYDNTTLYGTTTDTVRLTAVTNKMLKLKQLAAHGSSMKRSVYEGKLTKKKF